PVGAVPHDRVANAGNLFSNVPECRDGYVDALGGIMCGQPRDREYVSGMSGPAVCATLDGGCCFWIERVRYHTDVFRLHSVQRAQTALCVPADCPDTGSPNHGKALEAGERGPDFKSFAMVRASGVWAVSRYTESRLCSLH